ncbi:hypothetical protein LCGC14_1009930 [marine sediment metagenome]|uniref:Uncharacterized protein n=2 Tax=root TaxID=1 RepID=A0A831QJY9_9FLAO|nr:hypothetical protein [Pricia antarctica]
MVEFLRKNTYCIFIFFISALSAQTAKENASYLNWFDFEVGLENTPLFEGLGYVETYKSINEKHKFFNSDDFLNGSIVYDGQAYYDVRLKYDLYSDVVVINIKDGFEAVALQPKKSKIISFTVEKSDFINIGLPDASLPEISGFFEILFSSSKLKLLKKHSKRRVKKIGNFVYYEFIEDNFNILLYDGQYQVVSSNRDFRILFPDFKKEIRKYKIRKSDRDATMKALVNRISLLMSEENK